MDVLRRPVDAATAQGVSVISRKPRLAGCEIIPKQTKIISEQGDQGNWIVMQYYGDDFGG